MMDQTHSKKPLTFYVGLDIGGTKCSVVLGDNDFNIYDKVFFETKVERGPTVILNEFKQHIHQLLEKYDGKELVKIGISCGGPLNSKKGLIKSPPNLPGWDDIPIVDILEKEFGVGVALQNDANACALAEWMMGSGVGTENMIFLTFGTGMGAGLILNGKIYSGTNDLGGEVGHLRLADDGPVGFGKAGSFEGFCSGGGIAQLAKSMVEYNLKNNSPVGFCPSAENIEAITAKGVFTAVLQGDQVALEIVKVSAEYLGKALAILIDTLNPECIVIGSIYARNEALLKPLVYKVLEKEAIPEALEACRILPAKLGDKIGDYAALGVAMHKYQNQERIEINMNNLMVKDKKVNMKLKDIVENLIQRYPALETCKASVRKAGEQLIECYQNDGKLLVCGNGGSASDSDHIVGELMKSFSKKRPVTTELEKKLRERSEERGAILASKLERGLSAISLNAHGGLISAISNDIGGDFIFAQQVLGYGRKNDVLLAISTSGNSVNVLDACITANAMGVKVVGLLGETGGKIKSLCDVAVCVPAKNTAVIQELHLPIYHALCIMVEETFF